MRRLICIFSALLLLWGCVKNELRTGTGVSERKLEIAFDCPIIQTQMKSAVLTPLEDQVQQSFKVWAYYSPSDAPDIDEQLMDKVYMNAVLVSYDEVSGKWKPEGKYYWPNNGTLTFFAVYPATPGTSVGVDENGIVIDDYDASSATEDLLISEVALGCDGASAAQDGVQLNFKHALSSLSFNIRTDVASTTSLVVTRIALKEIADEGDYSQLSDPQWKKTGSEGEYILYDNAEGIPLTGNYLPEAVKTIIVLPHVLEDTEFIEVTYKMQRTGADFWFEEQTASAELNDFGLEQWMPGYRYAYGVTLSLDRIQCTTGVATWNPEDNNDSGSSPDDFNTDFVGWGDGGDLQNSGTGMENMDWETEEDSW